MTQLMDMTDTILNKVLEKEEDYYSYFYKKIKNNNNILYYSNVLASNLLHINFESYKEDEIINILQCAIKLITYTLEILNNKPSYTKEDKKIFDFASIQIINIYSNILEEFLSDEEYINLKQLRKYTTKNEEMINLYLRNNYNNSELLKLIYVYSLIIYDDIVKAKEIYNTYNKIENNHPFYYLVNNINKKIKTILK